MNLAIASMTLAEQWEELKGELENAGIPEPELRRFREMRLGTRLESGRNRLARFKNSSVLKGG